MTALRHIARRAPLSRLFFVFLLAVGIVPLALSSVLLIQQNREILETQERSYLTRAAETLSVELSSYLASTRRQLQQLGGAVLATPPVRDVEGKLRSSWFAGYLEDFLVSNPNVVALRVLSGGGNGPYLAPDDLSPAVQTAMDGTFQDAVDSGGRSYRFVVVPAGGAPLTVIAVPIFDAEGAPQVFVEAAIRLRPMEVLFQQEAEGDAAVFLIQRDGTMLWWGAADPQTVQGLATSRLVRDFVDSPLSMTQEYVLRQGGSAVRILGRASPVPETGWGVIVQKPAAAAYTPVREMIAKAALSTAVLLGLAFLLAGSLARRLSQPIQRLSDGAAEMASGNFGRRLEGSDLGRELNDLASNFNLMSGYVEEYVSQLKDAAQLNRELFLGVLKAFAAAIDAKDPYTRGHSERVARYSRAIAAHLGLARDQQEQAWVAGLIHDVGKIGVEDRILRKGTTLSREEFEQMKLHTVIGARIMSQIDQLHEVVPVIRSHHESLDGTGYPDGLAGDRIALMTRIVAVADTADAITTDRPYQRGFTPAAALARLEELVGSRFDARVVAAFMAAHEAGDIELPGRSEAPAAQPDPVDLSVSH
ncbi:MAG: HD domain-containing protein [Acidobacteriota bacterium]|nr:HD domain-containing protein [Acidobacteriota bacterium]MDH3522215.1 HD domain-containing protein [Acidobacteriota bacterium]